MSLVRPPPELCNYCNQYYSCRKDKHLPCGGFIKKYYAPQMEIVMSAPLYTWALGTRTAANIFSVVAKVMCSIKPEFKSIPVTPKNDAHDNYKKCVEYVTGSRVHYRELAPEERAVNIIKRCLEVLKIKIH
jgi:hypothetical protein